MFRAISPPAVNAKTEHNAGIIRNRVAYLCTIISHPFYLVALYYHAPRPDEKGRPVEKFGALPFFHASNGDRYRKGISFSIEINMNFL